MFIAYHQFGMKQMGWQTGNLSPAPKGNHLWIELLSTPLQSAKPGYWHTNRWEGRGCQVYSNHPAYYDLGFLEELASCRDWRNLKHPSQNQHHIGTTSDVSFHSSHPFSLAFLGPFVHHLQKNTMPLAASSSKLLAVPRRGLILPLMTHPFRSWRSS